MKIAVRRGHQYTGEDGASEGLVKEIEVAERYHQLVIQGFISQGHEVLDVTPPEADRELSDSLAYGISLANNWKADIFISCHANNTYDNFDGAIGCEVIYCPGSGEGKNYATRIESQLANLGFKSRGAKEDVRGLAEIHHTDMTCIIVEPFFVEATEDVATYKSVGDIGIANAIIKGITGQSISKKEEEIDMKKIVVYLGDADVFGAIVVAQKNGCPLMKKSDFETSGLKVNEIIQIGGKIGSDRFSTFKDAAALV